MAAAANETVTMAPGRGVPERPVAEVLAVPAAAITLSLILFGLFVTVAGADPRVVFSEMVRGSFGTWFSFQNTLLRAAPLMLTALCTALPARLGLIIIGNEGALAMGGLAAAAVPTLVPLPMAPAWFVLGMMLVAGFIAGGMVIALAGIFRAFRGVNETISSLLLTYIAIALMNHVVEGPLRDPLSLNKPSTVYIGDALQIGNMPGLDVHWGLGYGIIACLIAYVLMHRTVFGFAARMAGGNVRAALLAGLSVRKLTVVGCFLAGGAAGLAGMVEVAAVHGRANASLIAGYGYSGILVSFLARHHPLAIIPVAILLGGISASGGLLQRTAHLPDATVNVLQGILFIVILASETFYGRWRGRLSITRPLVVAEKAPQKVGGTI
jgi:ABC-type uncharacterized transport system permease subunit